MVEHVEKTRVEHDLRSRFDYISKFLNFTNDDILILNNLEKIVHPMIPSIVDGIYENLLHFDVTKNYFLIRSNGFNGTMTNDPDTLNLHCEQMMFRRDNLRKYLHRVLRQRSWNDAFLLYLSNVGKVHTNLAGAHSINIDYIHINLALGFLEHRLIDAIFDCSDLDEATKRSSILTINKFFWIQNDFFAMHYIRSSKK